MVISQPGSTAINSIGVWCDIRRQIAYQKTIGFIPTMGNLHQGHQSLFEKSKQENDITIISIYVNPTQFNNADDFANYPKTIEADLHLANRVGVDHVLIPSYSELYSDDYVYRITEHKLSQEMEGRYRPGHFDGVLTVVMKLLMLVRPDKVYFGEKDWQQLQLIKGMVKAFHCDVDVVACPTIRDQNGLALSSRNNLLSSEQYRIAINFPKLLASDRTLSEIELLLKQEGMQVDYVEEKAGRRFGAVRVGNVRLIDNIEVKTC